MIINITQKQVKQEVSSGFGFGKNFQIVLRTTVWFLIIPIFMKEKVITSSM